MLGVTLNQNLTLNIHVSSLSRSIHFTPVRSVNKATLTRPMAATLGESLVQSMLDYTNSIFKECQQTTVCPEFP